MHEGRRGRRVRAFFVTASGTEVGKTVDLDDATLARLYPGGPNEHSKRFEAATQQAVREGFLLEEDADEIDALAQIGRQPSGWKVE